MTARAHISMQTKLAAALLALGDIPYADAKLMTAAQLISLYHFDHNKLHAIEADDHFANLAPMLISAHREKSRRDTAIVAKVKRLARVTEETSRRLLARTAGEQRKSRWPSRPIPSRPFPPRSA